MNINQKLKNSSITKIEGILSYYFIDGQVDCDILVDIIKVRTNICNNKIVEVLPQSRQIESFLS